MLSFFRRALSSWLVLGLLGLVMVAFIITGVSDPTGLAGGLTRDRIATVGGKSVDSNELATRVQMALQNQRQSNPGLDINAFIAQGAVEQIANEIIDGKAIDVWAAEQGMGVSDRLIDGQIASIAAFKGPTGQFDQQVFQQMLAQQGVTEKQLRADIAGGLLRRQLLLPAASGAQAPAKLVTPYASLLLERRSGSIGIVPSRAMPPAAAPTPQEIQAHYQRTQSRYTLPERRVVRYAVFGKDQLAAVAKPTEAEIAAFYKANQADYAGKETRTLRQLVVPTEAQAKAIVAKIKGGQSFAAAAQAAGFGPGDTALGDHSRDSFAGLASQAAATAAFALPAGGTTDAVKSELGWHVIHVEKVNQTPARPLASVRAEIEEKLAKQKLDEAIAAKVAEIEDRIADGQTFDEVVKAEKLTVVTTPPVLPNGQAPDMTGWTAPPELPVLLKAAFEAAVEDDPTVETIGTGELHAILDVTSIVPSAPRPFAAVREEVAADLAAKRAFDRARAVAQSILAKVDAGMPMERAFAEAQPKLPPPQKAAARQADIARQDRPVPPPLAMMFAMAQGKTKLLPAPGNEGWFVVHLDSIEKADASKQPGLVQATQAQFARVLGEEYLAQFAQAVAKDVGVKRDNAAIQRVKAQLSGGQ